MNIATKKEDFEKIYSGCCNACLKKIDEDDPICLMHFGIGMSKSGEVLYVKCVLCMSCKDRTDNSIKFSEGKSFEDL